MAKIEGTGRHKLPFYPHSWVETEIPPVLHCLCSSMWAQRIPGTDEFNYGPEGATLIIVPFTDGNDVSFYQCSHENHYLPIKIEEKK